MISVSDPYSLNPDPDQAIVESIDGIFKLLRSLGIDSKESIPPSGRYDNSIPTRFLAHIL